MSRIKEGDLIFFYFPCSFFPFNLFSFISILELGLELELQDHAVTQQITPADMVISHMIHGRR